MSEQPVMNKMREVLYRPVPLGDDQLESERRRLEAALDVPVRSAKPSFRMRAVLIAAAALVLIGVGAMFLFTGSQPSETGMAPQTLAGLRWLKGAPLPEGVELRTTPQMGAKLVTTDGTAIWVDRESSVLSRGGGRAGVVLRRGNLLLDVRRRAADDPFVVQTPAGDVVVHGTVFSVRVREHKVLVRLYRGAVSMNSASREVVLRAGQAQLYGLKSNDLPVVLDRAAIIADLLIAETTADLAGPKIPVLELPVPPDANTHAPSVEGPNPSPSAPLKMPDGARKKPAAVPAAAVTEPSAPPVDPVPAPLSDPELAGIHVEQKEAPEIAPPPEEDLMDKALGEIREGHHDNGRTLLKQYLFKFPEGRYVEPVEEILSH